MQSKQYVLYVKDRCPFCTKAKQLLELNNISYHAVALDSSPVILQEMKTAWSWNTVPMVFELTGDSADRSVEFVGGYTDLRNRLESHG